MMARRLLTGVSMKRSVLALAALLISGCAGAPSADDAPPEGDDLPDLARTGDGGVTGPASADLAPPMPSPFPAGTSLGSVMPQITAIHPERVMASPRVVPITWDNDANRSTIESFFSAYAGSSAWAQQVSEYGVGALSVGTPRHMTGNAPTTATDSSIVQILTNHLNGSWGYPDSHTVYEFFFPAGAKPGDSGTKCCVDVEGYHSWVTVQGVDVAYAVVCMCPGFQDTVTDVQELTRTASHETVESVTDPFFDAYSFTDAAHAAFTYANQGEVGDMCEFADTLYWQPPDMTYTIQRMWSNKAAAAGHDPCGGAPAAKYYQTVPFLPDSVSVKLFDTFMSAQTMRIPVGQTAKVKLTVFADDPSAGPFDVTVEDYSSAWNNKQKLLDITVPPGPFAAGQTFEATVKVLGQDADLGGHAEEMFITTTPHAGGTSTIYFAMVGQP